MTNLFFSSNTNKNTYSVKTKNIQHLKSLAPDITKKIEKFGFCVINAWDNSYEALKLIAEQFGYLQSHMRANEDGIVGEVQKQKTEWQQHSSEYSGVGQEEFYPHSDGSFLNGMSYKNGEMQVIQPPKMLLLQCVKHAANGGVNYLIDGKKILEDLLEHDIEMLVKLFTPGCVTFCRDDLLALNTSVYELIEDKINLRFRYDFATYAPVWSVSTVKKLHYQYHMNPHNRILVDLQPNEILVIDNLRMLHARTAFENNASAGARKLRRAWIFNTESPKLVNVEGSAREHRAIQPFQNYHICSKPDFTNNALIKCKTGIYLPDNQLKKIYGILNTHFDKAEFQPAIKQYRKN